MKAFLAVSLCVLAALASSTIGDNLVYKTGSGNLLDAGDSKDNVLPNAVDSKTSASRSPGADGPVREIGSSTSTNSQHESQLATSKQCCYIGDLEVLLSILYSGKESLKHKAMALIKDVSAGCKKVDRTVTNAESKSQALKKYNAEDAEDFLEDEKIIKRNPQKRITYDIVDSCNVAGYAPLFPMLMHGSEEEKTAVFDAMMITIDRCNSEKRPSGEQYRRCDVDKDKYSLFFQWMMGRYMERMAAARMQERVLAHSTS